MPSHGHIPDYDSQATPDDVARYAYSAQGQQIYKSDQAGNVFERDYDTAGRLTQRRVTTLASGFDGAIRRIATTVPLTESL